MSEYVGFQTEFYVNHNPAYGEVDCLNCGRPASICGRVAVCCVTCENDGRPACHPRTTISQADAPPSEPDWRNIDPADKVRIITAMGFSPMGEIHTRDCPAEMSDGYICNCVPGSTEWGQPHDVDELRGETWEQRLAAAKRRDGIHA